MSARPKPGSSSCYCRQILGTAASLTRHYGEVLSPSGVTARQYYLLLTIKRAKSCSVSELSEMTGLDRSTLSRNLKPLFHKNLIDNNKAPGARNYHLEINPAGREALKLAHKLWGEAQRNVEMKLGSDGLSAFNELMKTLKEL